MSTVPFRPSAETLTSLNSLIDALEDVHDCLAEEGLDPDVNLRVVVEQAIAQVKPAEERKYQIVRVD